MGGTGNLALELSSQIVDMTPATEITAPSVSYDLLMMIRMLLTLRKNFQEKHHEVGCPRRFRDLRWHGSHQLRVG
jgi:hypothetical protein